MDAVKYGESSKTSTRSQKTLRAVQSRSWPSNLRRSSTSKVEIIELRGSSEDGEDSNHDSIPIVDYSTAAVTNNVEPRLSIQETKRLAVPKRNLMKDRPILPSLRTEWIYEPEEVEEVLEKGNPPRQPARHVNVRNPSKRRKLDRPPAAIAMSPRTSSPINLVSSSPLGPFPSHTKRHPDSSLSPTPTTIIAAKTSKAARSLSPGPAQTQDPSTPRPTPSPIPTRLASGSPLTKSRDFQTELIHALDRIYDGGRNRAAVREHETFDLLSHLHVPEDQMAVMLTWERNTRQWGQMYFTKQVEYITRYIDTYGHIIDQYGARAALKFHFGRLLAEGRLRPPYQSTPSYLSIEERTNMQNSSALKVFNAICKLLNDFQPPRQ